MARPRYILLIACLLGVVFSAGCATSSIPGELFAHAVVAADHPIASQAGAQILKQGGNAVDAAVATSFCLAVVRPYSCGLGGGGFMIVSFPPEDERAPVAINYRESSPGAVGRSYYVDLKSSAGIEDASRFGPHACGVPGTVAGLLFALDEYGTLDRAAVLAPAIRAAQEGVPADWHLVEALDGLNEHLARRPEHRAFAGDLTRIFLADYPVAIGDIVRQPALARALRLIAEEGAGAFYRGEIAEAITNTMSRLGGPITRADLATYLVRESAPLIGSFQEHTVLGMPPPSSGGIAMLQMFGIIERRLQDVDHATAPDDPVYVQLVAEAMKHAFADRAEWLADSAFVDVPVDSLTGKTYLDRLAASISLEQTGELFDYGTVTPAATDGGTSHLSIIDANGMAVACTETINLSFGSLVVVPEFGIVMNNEMDDFTTIPGAPNAFGLRQSDRNLPEPGKRPLSSMSPTILLKDGRPVIVAGGSGGPRIITGTMQCVLNCILFDMAPTEAVAAPRFHHQWMPETLRFEERWTNEATRLDLNWRGHAIDETTIVGQVQLIRAYRDGLRAASDPRKGGEPAGY